MNLLESHNQSFEPPESTIQSGESFLNLPRTSNMDLLSHESTDLYFELHKDAFLMEIWDEFLHELQWFHDLQIYKDIPWNDYVKHKFIFETQVWVEYKEWLNNYRLIREYDDWAAEWAANYWETVNKSKPINPRFMEAVRNRKRSAPTIDSQLKRMKVE